MNKIEKLNHLITILENTPSKNIDLREWSNVEGEDDKLDVKILQEKGVLCCAIGWASLDKTFNKLHFFGRNGLGCFKPYLVDNDSYVRTRGWDAVERFFEIELDDAEYLFDFYKYPVGLSDEQTKQEVIKRIKEYIAKVESNE